MTDRGPRNIGLITRQGHSLCENQNTRSVGSRGLRA